MIPKLPNIALDNYTAPSFKSVTLPPGYKIQGYAEGEPIDGARSRRSDPTSDTITIYFHTQAQQEAFLRKQDPDAIVKTTTVEDDNAARRELLEAIRI